MGKEQVILKNFSLKGREDMKGNGFRRVGVLITVFALLFWAFVVYGAEKEEKHPIDVWIEKCMDKANTDQDMVQCAIKDYEMWDKELNKVYKTLMEKLNPEEKEALKKSQRKWLEFEDAEFKFIDKLYDLPGLLNVVGRYGWKVEIIRERALRLQKYLNDIKQTK